MFRTTTRQTDRRARLGVQALEAREVPALIGGGGRPPVLEVPDYAGSTMESARVLTLPAMQEQSASDYLPSSGDVDVYRISLKKGDFLAADVDSASRGPLSSTLQVLDAAGNQLAVAGSGSFGLFHTDPRIGCYAPADGNYYLRLTTSNPTYSFDSGYTLHVERVGIEEDQSAATLQDGGAFHAWLNAAGDTLHLTGPTGYGFSLRGTWTKAVDGSTITYAAQGTMYLRTGALGTEIALQVAGRTPFTVKTTTAGWHQLGELTAIGGKFGLSLAPVADQIRQTFGLDVSNVALAAGWTIKTGAQIKEAYQGYTQREIVQLLDGVPYLVYGQAGRFRMQFGQVSVAATDQAKTVLIADPADPFLYVGYKNYAAAGSLHGRIPFNTSVTPPSDGRDVDYFGHVYAAGSFPLTGVPATVNGDVTVDLDANGDGMFLGGSGNASELFRGNLGAIDGVLRDIQVGVNGTVDLGYTVAGVAVRVPVGEASVFYSGPKGGVWFEGAQGSAMNPWAGTVLAKFRGGPGTKVEGYVMRDGTFSVATTSNYRLFAANAALTLTVTNASIGAQGTVTTPIGKADVAGTIGFNGNFHWVASAQIDVGGSSNYLRGGGTMTFDRTGSVFTATTAVDARMKLSIPGFKAEGDVTGTLKITFKPDGTVSYAGSLTFDGGIYAREPITGDWNKIGSVDVGLGLSGKKLTLKAFGKTFAMNLPG